MRARWCRRTCPTSPAGPYAEMLLEHEMSPYGICSTFLFALCLCPGRGRSTAETGDLLQLCWQSCPVHLSRYRALTESVPLPSRFDRGRTLGLSHFAKTAEHKHGGDLLGKRAPGAGMGNKGSSRDVGMGSRGQRDLWGSGDPPMRVGPHPMPGDPGSGGGWAGRRGRCPRC